MSTPKNAILMLLLVLPLLSCLDTPKPSATPSDKITGIDVSHYQGVIDWQQVDDSDVSFVFIKATQGHETVDKLYTKHWDEAGKTGLLRGVYHFFDPSVDAKSQAMHFLAITQSDFGDFPPVIDIETHEKQSKTQILESLAVFVTLVEQKTSCKPMIYTSPKFWDSLASAKFNQHSLWLADYNAKLELPEHWKQWLFWQFESNGDVPGVKGDVDMSLFSKNRNELEQLKCKPA